MRFRFGRASVILAMLLAASGVLVEAAPAISTVPDPALVDAIVHKMESDGTLDRAIDRALQRRAERQQQAQRQQQLRQRQELEKRAKLARPVAVARDHIRGDPGAEVSLIEYSDFECPYCKRFYPTVQTVLEQYDGRVNWVLRNYPLPFHEPAARREALAAECAAEFGGNRAFWSYADAIFANTRSNGRGLAQGVTFESLAKKSGLGSAVFSRCLAAGKGGTLIDEDMRDGAKVGVTGTPTTLIRNNQNGATEVLVGAVDRQTLKDAVERMLAAH